MRRAVSETEAAPARVRTSANCCGAAAVTAALWPPGRTEVSAEPAGITATLPQATLVEVLPSPTMTEKLEAMALAVR